MIPMQYYANVELPFYGWFGKSFSSTQEARDYVADMLRKARQNERVSLRPRRAVYYIKPRLLRLDD